MIGLFLGGVTFLYPGLPECEGRIDKSVDFTLTGAVIDDRRADRKMTIDHRR